MTPREREILDALTERPRDVRALALAVLGAAGPNDVANMRVRLRRLAGRGLAAQRDGTDPAVWESREESRP